MTALLRTRHTGGSSCPQAALATAACGAATTDGAATSPSKTPAGSGAASSPSTAAFTPATSGELNLYTWSDYIPQALVDRFSKETGIRMKVSFYDSDETLEAKLKASGGTGYDLVVPSDCMVANLIKENLIQPIDLAPLPNGSHIKPDFLDVYFDRGRTYSVPYFYGTTGYAYDSKVVTTPMTTWTDYFAGPAEAAGKIGIFNDQVDGVNAALRAVGGQPCTTAGTNLQATQDLLVAFRKKVATIDSDGTTLWQDNSAMPTGAKNAAQALTFLNWFLDPKNAAEAANAQGYNSGVAGVDDLLDASMKAHPAVVVPAADLSHVAPAPPCDAAATNSCSKIWEKFKS